MTISLAWVRRNRDASELILASDSRLRSRGAIDQAQKIIRLERGDCALSFCGDAQVAYPLFMQVGSTLNNFIKTRSRAEDVTNLSHLVKQILNGFIESWDLPEVEKAEELRATRIILSGWSWRLRRYYVGLYVFDSGSFEFKRTLTRLPHPWHERARSFLFAGDYEEAYLSELSDLLARRHGLPSSKGAKQIVDLNYEPIEALNAMLKRCAGSHALPAIGGSPQVLKIYPFGQSLPVVVRTEQDAHFLFGRRLLPWEKTEYPILDLVGAEPSFLYPMSEIPVPNALRGSLTSQTDELGSLPLDAPTTDP